MTDPGVLFLTESHHPVLGGGETHVRHLSQRLVRRGMPATVVTRRTDPAWAEVEDDQGVRVVRVPPAGPGRRGKYAMVPAALRAVAAERKHFGILVVRGTRVLGLPGVLAARALGKAIVLQAEVNGEMSGEVYTWGTRFDRGPVRGILSAAVRARNLLLRRADLFVAMSRAIRDEFLAAGVEPARIAHVPHGVDTARFHPADPRERARLRHALGLASDGPLLVYTGRLLRGKGLEALLAAFSRVATRHPDVRLALVGSGDNQSLSVETALRAEVAARGLGERVTFTGRQDDVAPYVRAADLFAFPSLFEALGLSVVEAAACGVPVVASRTGGIPDVIEDGLNGSLVPPGDVTALEGAIDDLLADPVRRAAFGRAGRARACARFDLEDSVETYRALFRELAPR